MNELININNRLINPFFNTVTDFISFADSFEGEKRYGNFEENGDFYSMTVDVPGVTKSDLELLVTPEKEIKLKGATDDRSRKRAIDKTLSSPVDANTDKIEAKLENGVLHISIPKVAKAKNSKVKIT